MFTSHWLTSLPNNQTRSSIEDLINAENFKSYNVSVTNASGKSDNYLGIIQRIQVSGVDEHGKPKDIYLILKSPLNSKSVREDLSIDAIYKREIRAYATNLPNLVKFQNKFDIPEKDIFKYVQCFKTGANEMEEFLIFEDMKRKNYNMADRKTSLDFKHLKLSIGAIANFHALSFAMRHKDPELFAELIKDLEDPLVLNPAKAHFFDIVRDKAVAVLEDPEHITKLKSFGKGLMEKLKTYTDPATAEPYNVICHGDCWTNNMLFKYDEDSDPVDLMLLDWQIMRYASPITDLAFFFFTSTDEDTRRQHYQEMIEFYYASLKRQLSIMGVILEDVYPDVIFKEHQALLMPFGLAMSLIMLPSILSEEGDTMDISKLLEKDEMNLSDVKYKNEKSFSRYAIRMKGVVNDFVKLNLI